MVVDADSSLTEIVVAEVAQYKGVDETSLSQPLYDAINPEALDALFNEGSGEVSFQYLDLHVVVNSDQDVEVYGAGQHNQIEAAE